MDLDARIALVARTWTPTQQLHPGNVAWQSSGGDGALPADMALDGDGWFADVWRLDNATAEVDGHFSPDLFPDERQFAFDKIRAQAPRGSISLVADAPMADTLRAAGVRAVEGPFFLLQHRSLDQLPRPSLPSGFAVVSAEEAGENTRVEAHRLAWAPARVKELLGLTVTGNEPQSSFNLDKYRAIKARQHLSVRTRPRSSRPRRQPGSVRARLARQSFPQHALRAGRDEPRACTTRLFASCLRRGDDSGS